MTTLLERGIEKAKALPEDRQDELGEMLLAYVEQQESPLRLSPEQNEIVRQRMAAPSVLVPEAEMDAFFQKLIG